MRKYLIALLTEKGITKSIQNEMMIEGHFGLTYDMQIRFICSAPKNVIKQIRDTFVKIDFKQGDVKHYWNHLTEGMLKHQGYEVKIN